MQEPSKDSNLSPAEDSALCGDTAIVRDNEYWDEVSGSVSTLEAQIAETRDNLRRVDDAWPSQNKDGSIKVVFPVADGKPTAGEEYYWITGARRVNDDFQKAVLAGEPLPQPPFPAKKTTPEPWRAANRNKLDLDSYVTPVVGNPEESPDSQTIGLTIPKNNKGLDNITAIRNNPDGFAAYKALHKKAGEVCRHIEDVKKILPSVGTDDGDLKEACHDLARTKALDDDIVASIADRHGLNYEKIRTALDNACESNHDRMDYSLLLPHEAPPPTPTPRGDSSGRGVVITRPKEGGLAVTFTQPYAPEAVEQVFSDYNEAHPENPVEIPKGLSGNAGTVNIAAPPGSVGELQAFLNEKLVGAMPLAAPAKGRAL